MRSRIYASCTSLSIAAFLLSSAAAQAQPAAPKRERSLAESLHGAAKDAYTAASLLYKQGVFVEAEGKYSQAYDLSKDPRLVFNMAACEKEMHHYARMGTLLRQYKDEAGASLTAEDRKIVDEALAALPRYIGSVTINVDPRGATVTVDGESIGTAPLATPVELDPGKHTIGVRKEGFEGVERPISVVAGNSTALTIDLLAQGSEELKGAPAPPRPAMSVTAPAPAAEGRKWSPIVYVGFGVAGAGLVVGGVTGALALGKASSLGSTCQGQACPPTANDALQTGRTMATVSTVSFAVAGVGAAVGVIALLLSPRREQAPKSAFVGPWVGPGTAGVEGTF